MRSILLTATGLTSFAFVGNAFAGEVPLAGPLPEWVVAAPDPDPATIPKGDNAIPLFDEQVYVEGDLAVAYVDAAQTVSNAEQMQRAGTLSVSWQPDHGDVTFHRIEILRGSERIDLLKEGPKFTVLRREAGLESQILDGTLTATRQLEGLRIGDVVRFSYSISERDSTLGGKVQSGLILLPKPLRIGFGRARIVWPKSEGLRWKSMLPTVTAEPKSIVRDRMEISIPLPVAQLPELPKDIPARFQPAPLLTATNFADWGEVASVMAPLYTVEGAIADGSDLAKVTDAIAVRHTDPVERMAAALQVVQSDVRYLLVALGSGNYTPQSPSRTWELRYGDCKAKSLLLTAMLTRLGITAEPVLASVKQGGRVVDSLPAPQAFDHVIVRAEGGGESFWLDGTNLGSRLADIRDVPRFGHVLPLRPSGAALIKLPVRADARPSPEVMLAYDNSAGAHLPAPFTLTVTYHGAVAEQSRENIAGGDDEKLRTMAENLSETWTGSKTVLKPVTSYDPVSASLKLVVEGVGYPDWTWRDGHMELDTVPALRVTFDPDRSKSAWRPLPALIDSPWTARATVVTQLPAEGAGATVDGADERAFSFPAVAYKRTVTREGARLTEQMTVAESGADVPSDGIAAMRKTVADLAASELRVMLPADYPMRWDDVQRMKKSPALARVRRVFDQRIAEKPDDSWRISDRAWLEERLLDWAAAEKLYTRAIEVDSVADHYLSRSGVRSALGDDAGALADAQLAYDLDTSSKVARATLAMTLAETGLTDDALALYPSTIEPSTDDGQAELLSRADSLMRGKRPDESIELLDAALRKRATSPELLNSRCWVKALAGVDLGNALADCTRAIELAADPAAYFDSRALVHYRAGEMDAALADINAALALNPELAPTRYLRGVIAKQQGRGKDAATDLGVARQLDPSIDGLFARYGINP